MKTTNSIFKTFFLSLCIIANTHFAYGQTASILPPAETVFLDSNGKPLTSGTVDFYIPSTTTRKTTWQDAAETIPNSNPVVLDAAGRGLILGSGSYRQVVKDRNGNLIWDQVTSSTGSGSSGPTATGDGDLVGTIKPWAGMTAPNQYVFTYGQELSRTTYAALFTAITSSQTVFCTSGNPILNGLSDTTNFWIGMTVELSCLAAGKGTVTAKTATTVTLAAAPNVTSNVTAVFFPWGNGNSSTTFNVPDFRGFAIAGNNNMGGTANSVLTTTYFGSTNPNSIGAAGGSQSNSVTLLAANLPPITSTNASQAISVAAAGNAVFPGLASGDTWTAVAGSNGSGNNWPRATSNSGPNSFSSFSGNNSISVTSTGTSSTPIVSSLVQPTKTSNYIIKVTPDTNSATASGVTSLGGMTGNIACGASLLCTGNVISVSSIPIATNSVIGGLLSSQCSTSNWFNSLGNGTGIFNCAQPGFSDISGIASLAQGGTNANLTASNGGIFWSNATQAQILAGTATANQMLMSGSSSSPSWSTSTWPASVAKGNILNASAANVWAATSVPVLGNPGTLTGTLGFAGVTSGTATITPQSIAGTPILTLPNASGTFAVSATTPIVLSSTTGALTCPTCATSSGGGAITGTAPVTVSAGGVVSITGAAGQILAGASPAFTATPTLGASGTLGSLAFGNATSGTVTLNTVTGALGSVTASLPANTGTLAELNLAQTWTAIQTFTNSDFRLLGSSTGYTTFTSSNAGSSNYTWTFPAVSDTFAGLTASDQTLSGGANVTSKSQATGNITIDCGASPLQYITAQTSAWTITAPANDGSCMLLITNPAASAVVPTLSGFTVGSNTGGTLTNSNNALFTLQVWRIHGTSGYSVFAHQ